MPERIRVLPNDNVGAEIVGVDVRAQLDEPTKSTLTRAFEDYGLLVIRGLELDTETQIALGNLFGQVVLREKNVAKREERRTQHVSNVTDDGVFGTGELDFHMDQLFWDTPLKALMLYGLEIPSHGGDTLFADTSRAYERMPDNLKSRIDDCRCRHAYTFSGDLAKDWHVEDAETQDLSVTHPIVWRSTDGARAGLWVNAMTTIGVEGLSDEDSRELMTDVRSYLYDDAITYRHQWRKGDLLVWDNRWIQHARTPFDETEARTLRRTTLL